MQGKRIERHLEKVPVKAVSAYTVVGQSPRRKDALEKVTGKAKYAGDMTLPGTLHARILRPPAHGATLKDVDTTAAEKVAGARVVRDGDLIAVLHERRDVADKALALDQGPVRPPAAGPWTTRPSSTTCSRPRRQASVVDESGNLAEGEKLAATLVEKTYLNSYVAHAAMETHSATAAIEDGKATVWASTQAPFSVQAAGGAGAGLHAAERARHHALRRRRLRRQERVPAGGRGGAAGEAHRQAGAGGVGPRRGVLLRHVPAGGRGEDPRRA